MIYVLLPVISAQNFGNFFQAKCKDDAECEQFKKVYGCDHPDYSCIIKKKCPYSCGVCTDPCYLKKCNYDCKVIDGKAQCICPENFDNCAGTGCIDENECERLSNPCPNSRKPYCHNIPGSYRCSQIYKCPENQALYREQEKCCKKDNSEMCGQSMEYDDFYGYASERQCFQRVQGIISKISKFLKMAQI